MREKSKSVDEWADNNFNGALWLYAFALGIAAIWTVFVLFYGPPGWHYWALLKASVVTVIGLLVRVAGKMWKRAESIRESTGDRQ